MSSTERPSPLTATPSATVARRSVDWAVLGVLAVIIIAALMVYPEFDTSRNIVNILRQNVPLALVAMAMTLVLIGGQFDLSVGATYGASGVLFAGMLESSSFATALLLALLFGTAVGGVNALLVAGLKLPSFMCTFASAMAILGCGLLYSDTQIPITDKTARALAQPEIFGLPADVLFTGALGCLLGLALSRTVWGRALYAVGGNREAARLSGLRVTATTASTFVIAGGVSALAGIISVTRTGSAFATMGSGIPLAAIAVVVVGGTSIWGGRGAIWRTVVGVLILAVLGNVFNGLSAPTSTIQIVTGLAVVLAIGLQKRPTGERI